MSENLAVVVPVYNEQSISRTLTGLYAQNRTKDIHHFVVNNGSTDNTLEKIDDFLQSHEDFPLTLLEEPQKGTGAAADTGFRHAIDSGYSAIARTDGDSVPSTWWTQRIVENFEKNHKIQLLGGKSSPLHDYYYRRGDELLLPTAIHGARLVLALQHMNSDYLKIAIGHNMATRAAAYEQVGGFTRTSIDEKDEDIDYSLKIAKEFGRSAIFIDPMIQVETSMRRIREYGVAGTAIHHLFPSLRTRIQDEIDVR